MSTGTGSSGWRRDDKFKPDERITWEQVGDKALKHYFGPEHGLDWFKEHGFMMWPKKVEEAYWRWFVDARVPIYLEFMIDLKEKMKKASLTGRHQIELGAVYTLYKLVSLRSPSGERPRSMTSTAFRTVISCTQLRRPWRHRGWTKSSAMNPYTYNMTMNADTAKRKA